MGFGQQLGESLMQGNEKKNQRALNCLSGNPNTSTGGSINSLNPSIFLSPLNLAFEDRCKFGTQSVTDFCKFISNVSTDFSSGALFFKNEQKRPPERLLVTIHFKLYSNYLNIIT